MTNQIKIVFTGSVGAGKTTAIGIISEVDPITTEAKPTEHSVFLHKQTTTVAMDYGELTLEDNTKLYLYGTPGQRRFDFMTHILTKGALGLIILIDNSHNSPLEELDYYLNLNAEFLLNNPAVIAITHSDITSHPNVDDYCDALKERGDTWPIVYADVRQPKDVAMLLQILFAILEYNNAKERA